MNIHSADSNNFNIASNNLSHAFPAGPANLSTEGNSHIQTDKSVNSFVTENGIQIKAQSKESGALNKLKNKLTHVNVKDGNSSISLNIGSLSKRTNTSILSIFAKKMTGNLDTTYVNNQANISLVLNSVRQNAVNGQDPKQAEKQMAQTIKTAQKTNIKTKEAVFTNVQIGSSNYTVKIDTHKNIQVLHAKDSLGEGNYGKVKSLTDMASGAMTTLVQKEAKAEVEGSIPQLRNEFSILTYIHDTVKNKGSEKKSTGLPAPPHCLIEIKGGDQPDAKGTEGYLVEKFDHDLSSDKFYEKPVNERFEKSFDLVEGLATLHELDIVHGDIKPENCSSKDGDLRLEDFGGARTEEAFTKDPTVLVNEGNILGVHTDFYRHKGEHPIKLLEEFYKNPNSDDLLDVAKAHDVYSLGLTILSNLGEKNIESSYDEFMQSPKAFALSQDSVNADKEPFELFVQNQLDSLKETNPQGAQLLGDMLSPRATRPSIEEVKSRYASILSGGVAPAPSNIAAQERDEY